VATSFTTRSNIAEHEAAIIFSAQPPSAFVRNTAGRRLAIVSDGSGKPFRARA
jgi:hypothetical protein